MPEHPSIVRIYTSYAAIFPSIAVRKGYIDNTTNAQGVHGMKRLKLVDINGL